MTGLENLSGTLRKEAEISFKKYCNNPLFKDVYIRAFIRALIGPKQINYE